MDWLAASALASVGETNPHPKWRVRLLQLHRDAVGAEDADTLMRYLFQPLEPDAEKVVREAIAYANGLVGRILERHPQLVPALGVLNEHFPTTKEAS